MIFPAPLLLPWQHLCLYRPTAYRPALHSSVPMSRGALAVRRPAPGQPLETCCPCDCCHRLTSQALQLFLVEFSTFDWDRYGLTLAGPVPLASFPNAAGEKQAWQQAWPHICAHGAALASTALRTPQQARQQAWQHTRRAQGCSALLPAEAGPGAPVWMGARPACMTCVDMWA